MNWRSVEPSTVSVGPWACSAFGRGSGLTPSAAAWPLNNLAVGYPFRAVVPLTIKQFWWVNGSTLSGNIDMGVYDIDGNLITSIWFQNGNAAVAQAGSSAFQGFTLATPWTFGPGIFYVMFAASSSTGVFWRLAPLGGVSVQRMLGMVQQVSALPLPTTATFASITNAVCPMAGFATEVL